MKASAQTTATTLVTTATAAGVFSLNIQGLPNFRARMSAYTDGSAVVTASLARSNK
jgi:phage tail sheath gpL-like